MIRLHGVALRRGGRVVVARADCRVAPGRGLCLLGPSGCGKTTLIEIAAGILRPDAGRAALGSARVGCMFQDDALLPWLDCTGNVAYVLRGPARRRRAQAAPWLDRLGLPPGAKPAALSGGMRRRLNLARALAARPDVLLLDEPFAFLDPAWRAQVRDLLDEALDNGAALLLTGHAPGPFLPARVTPLPLPPGPLAVTHHDDEAP